MGAGIALEIDKRNKGLKDWLISYINSHDISCPIIIPSYDKNKRLILNLITKENYWNKPDYHTITHCISRMADFCKGHSVKHLAMPKIGCGLDRLSWNRVKEIIIEEFKDIDIEIIVRYL